MFELKCMCFNCFPAKSTKCRQKCLIIDVYSRRLAPKLANFRRLLNTSHFQLDQIWPPSWMTSRAPAAPQPIIYTSSCRAHHRLSIKNQISS